MAEAHVSEDCDSIFQAFDALSFEGQRSVLTTLQSSFRSRVDEKRSVLAAQMRELDALGSGSTGSAHQNAGGRESRTGTKVPPKYRSLRDPGLLWSGRGGTPRWMVAEMQETGQPKEAFLIDG